MPLTFGEWFFVFPLPFSVLFDFAGVRDANYALEAATNHRASVEGVRARAHARTHARTHVNSFARIRTCMYARIAHALAHARSVFVLNNPWNIGGKKTKFRGVSSKRVSLVKSPTDDEALKKFRLNNDVEKEN